MNFFLRTLLLFSVIGFGIAVQAQDNTRFTLVRDVSELNDGDAVVIVDSEEGAALGKRIKSPAARIATRQIQMIFFNIFITYIPL